MVKKITSLSGVLLFMLCLSAPQKSHAQISLDLGGYMQNWYIAHESNEIFDTSVNTTRTIETQGFRVRRARLTARGNINDRFSATTWLEFAGANPSLLDFHMDAHFRPWFNIRMGQFRMAGQTYDTGILGSASLRFFERPNITSRVAGVMGYSAFRDIGVMAYGQHGRLWYGVHYSNGAGRSIHAGSNISERDFGGGLYGARVDVEVIDGMTLGGHVSTNQQRNVVQSGNGPFDIDRTSWSLRFATNNFGIDGLFSQFEYVGLTGKDDSRGVLLNDDDEYDIHGFYAELGYRMTREWHILGRYDEMVEKPGQAGLENEFDRFASNNYTLGISRFIYSGNSELARIYLNYSFGDSGPTDLENSILMAVFQLRFIP